MIYFSHAVKEKEMSIQPFRIIKYSAFQMVGRALLHMWSPKHTLRRARYPFVRFAGESSCADLPLIMSCMCMRCGEPAADPDSYFYHM